MTSALYRMRALTKGSQDVRFVPERDIRAINAGFLTRRSDIVICWAVSIGMSAVLTRAPPP